MRVLVTGGAGFIGSHLVTALLRGGARVGIVDDCSTGSVDSLDEAWRLGLRRADLFIEDIATAAGAAVVERWRPDRVFHLAAQSRVVESIRDPRRDVAVNVLGTVNSLHAAQAAGVTRFVAASSGGTVYGQLPGGIDRVAESAVRRPVSPYGVGKAAADDYLRVFEELYGLPTTTVRLGNVYGPRNDTAEGNDVVTRFVRAVAAGQPPQVCGDGTQTRDFVHVDDVVGAFLLAAERGLAGAVNVASGVETSVADLARLVCAAFGAAFEPEYHQARPGEVRRVCLDTTRARAELGWRPRIPLPEGIRRLAGVAIPVR